MSAFPETAFHDGGDRIFIAKLLTLSRLKNALSPALKKQVQAKAAEQFGEFAVTGFTLYRSILRPSGAIHEPVERYKLTAQPMHK